MRSAAFARFLGLLCAAVRRYDLHLFAYCFGRRGRVPDVLSGFYLYMGISPFITQKRLIAHYRPVLRRPAWFYQAGAAFCV